MPLLKKIRYTVTACALMFAFTVERIAKKEGLELSFNCVFITKIE